MKLSEWMAWKKLSDEQLAESASVDRVTISRIRRGANRPSWELAAKLKEISDGAVTADDFLERAS